MKLEIGMYCYDKANRKLGIGQIIGFRENNNVVIEYKNGCVLISMGNIVASHNLANLIKIGDYVNCGPVCHVEEDEDGHIWIYTNCNYKYGFLENEIEDVVLKEQFNSMKYEVGE